MESTLHTSAWFDLRLEANEQFQVKPPTSICKYWTTSIRVYDDHFDLYGDRRRNRGYYQIPYGYRSLAELQDVMPPAIAKEIERLMAALKATTVTVHEATTTNGAS